MHGERISADARDSAIGARLGRRTVALILAGGRGSRLGPLTAWRAKPAVPFAGKFRIIDFSLSNCVNSGIRRIGICTQYKAQSLIRHLQRGWSFLDGRFDEFIELLPPQQRITADWYKGTADAVYQNLDLIRRNPPDHVLVLAGDHVYKMDYGPMLAEHVARGADMSIGCVEVPLERARGFGVMQVEDTQRIIGFEEKPENPQPIPGRQDAVLASMGIYVFDAEFLNEQLIRDAADPNSGHDFGGDVIPYVIGHDCKVYAHRFADSCINIVEGEPYWRDVGTIDAYWEANLDLCQVTPRLNLYDETWPIWTYQEQLPPAKFVLDQEGRRGIAIDSLVAGGCIISGATVRRSLLFSNVRIHSYSTIEDSVILGNVDIGRHAVIRGAVIDKYCRIPEGMRIGTDDHADDKRFYVTPHGITLITPEMLGQPFHHLP